MSSLLLKSIVFEDSEGNTITIDLPEPIHLQDWVDNTKSSACFYTGVITGASISKLGKFLEQEKEEQA